MYRRMRWVASLTVAAAVAASFGVCAARAAEAPAAAAPAPATASAKTAEYTIRQGDVLKIDVWGFDEFSVESVPVRTDGKISFPTIGDIYVVDQTPPQLSNVIALGIKKYVSNPKVVVTVLASNTDKYYVSGSVTNPGTFNLTAGTGVREAIVAAGDLTMDANDQKATLLREGRRIPVDLEGALRGEADRNLTLQPGDTLSIDQALVTFQGYVNKTGQQALRRGSTLTQALATAGGVRDGADIDRVQIVRGNETMVVNLREIQSDLSKDVNLVPGDIVNVLAADDRTVPVFITGSVGHQGLYRYLPGRRDSLQDAINWAGGMGGDADLRHVKLRRATNDGTVKETVYDLRSVDSRSVQLQPNDYIEVPRRHRNNAMQIVSGSLGTILALVSLFRLR